ncbi:branched-chain amino acid ABC transporter permease [Nitratireductor sp. XY-223]|uniref:branched-chain amino acid ABC transporter permease n=1 Tax=Nitratireductor sp. XY-223 TaxID=2561926 RepID=UPI0010AADF7A|nr:branched-chain amino acid ABC transporter permease [Nitratireductor sp. XY-223]
MNNLDRTELGFIAALPLLIACGLLLPQWIVNYIHVSLGTGLVALGVMVQMRAGLVSFGQGLYFCIGGYAAGLAGRLWGLSDFFLLIALGIAAGLVVSFLLGFLLRRYRRIFYAMLSLAVSMILFGLLSSSEELGSTDGFNLPATSYLGWLPGQSVSGDVLYVATCIPTVICAILLHRFLRSPMGYVGEALRENEIRIEYLGMSARKAVHIIYVIAAVVSSIGGVLWAMALGHIDPEMTNWVTSAQFVFIAILSGIGNVAAPLFGTLLLEFIRVYAVEIAPDSWHIIVGSVMLLIIVFLPRGLWSLVSSNNGLKNKFTHRVKAASEPEGARS